MLIGLIVDDRFSWSFHIDLVCERLRAILAKFYILKPKVPFKTLLNMYIALAESIIAYGITSYGRTFKTYVDRIYKLQVRFLRLMVPCKISVKCKNNVLELFKYCKILPAQLRFEQAFLTEQHNNKDIQKPISHKIITRSITKNQLIIPQFKNFYGRRTSKYLIPKLINKIPLNIKNEINSKNYRHKYKKYYHNYISNMV
ncbi:hypothetical protein SFRURICE_003935 [Spodoptera frugiperda]|nr:hypothetical protein SFRURICE_003935 [Spodoptera frugiperda]